MAYDTSNLSDQEKVWSDRLSPKAGLEKRTIGSAAVTFTTQLTGGIPYLGFANGACVYYTLDGSTPTLAEGTTGAGCVAPNGLYEPMLVPKGEVATLKAICSGSQVAFFTVQRASLSSSV